MYTIKQQVRSFMVSDSVGTPLYWYVSEGESVVRDREGQAMLKQYLEDAELVFKGEVSKLLDTKRPFTAADEERLRMMLSLLTDARKTWEEEEVSKIGPRG